jgi:hypothetical protein
MSDDDTGADVVTLDAVAAWLAGSRAFQAYTGTDSAEAAAARVIEIDGDVLAVAHAVVDTPLLRFTRTAGGGHDGTAEILIAFAAPPVAGEDERASHRRALRHIAAIRRDLIEAIGSRLISIAGDPPVILDPSDGLPVWVEWSLVLTVEVAP